MDKGLMQESKIRAVSQGGFPGAAAPNGNPAAGVVCVALLAAALLAYLGWRLATEGGQLELLVSAGIAVIALGVAAGILRIFHIPLDAPKGRLVTRTEAPRLFETLDKMCKKLDGPPIHQVLVDREYHAEIIPLRSRALSGEYTHYLVLGLPYMLGVPAKEMLSAISYDYGYLCGAHGKAADKLFRHSRTVARLHQQLHGNTKPGRVDAWFIRLFERLIKSYQAKATVFFRQNARAAELVSTKMFGPQIRANGLIRDALLKRWMKEGFWPKLMKQAETHPRPTFMPFAAMRMAFEASYDQWATRERLTEVWTTPPADQDIHPSLRERVEAIGQPGMLPAPVRVTAAAALLEDAARRIIDEFDRAWWKEEKKQWDLKFLGSSRAKSRVRSLADFKSHEQKELASLSAEFDSLEQAKPILADIVRQPGGPFPKAAYLYGRILLEENDDSGLEHLATAAESDSLLADEAVHAGYFYVLNKYGEQAAQTWWERFIPTAAEA